MKHNYKVVVGNVGTMDYTSKKMAMDCFKTYRTMSIMGETRAANEPVTLLKNGEIIDEYIPKSSNLIVAMFDINKIKGQIANCPKNEVTILCPNWPINKPTYPEDIDPETENWDFEEFEQILGVSLYVTDYNDLIADPHGIYSA